VPACYSIGVLSPFIEGDYFSLLLNGIRAAIQPHHVQVLAFQGTPADLRTTHLGQARVAGWIVIVETTHIQDIAPIGTPFVTIAAVASDHACPAVLTDNHGGILAAVAHLYTHGHRQIAFVGPLNQLDFQQRYAGYQAALSAHQLPFDPDLVYIIPTNEELGGRDAAQHMLAADLPCTAVVTATDEIAIGLMEVLQAAERHIPTDVAIISFDDIDRAQYTDPALTTIRQHPEALGRTAATLLMQQLTGHEPVADITYVPTTLILRHSCGCAGAPPTATLDTTQYQRSGWQNALTQQLVRRLCAALPLDMVTPPAVVWPGAASLTQALAFVLSDGQLPPAIQIEQAWHQAVVLTSDLETLDSVFQELRQATMQHLAALPTASPVHRCIDVFLDRTRRSLMHACLAHERAKLHYFQTSVQGNHAISLRLLGAEMDAAPGLAWLSQTDMTSGCLGLWAETPAGTPSALVLAGHYERDITRTSRCGSRYAASSYPPDEILSRSAHADQADCVLVLPVCTTNREWGLLTICAPFAEQFAVENSLIWASLLGVALERSASLTALTTQQAALRTQQETLQVAYTRERELVESIRVSEERYALAARAANDGLWDWDLTTNTVYYSARWKALVGIDATAASTDPETWLSRVHPADHLQLTHAIADHCNGVTAALEYEHRIRDQHGAYRWMLCRGIVVRDDTVGATRLVGSLTDMTDRKQLEERLRHAALYDGLTGLPNRALFLDRLERVITHARRDPDYRCAVLFLDLDGFKIINDSLGHFIGDQLLICVAERLKTSLRSDDTAARFGGDEFAILLNGVGEMPHLLELADRMQSHLATPFHLDGHDVVVSASIGITINLAHYTQAADVLRDADIAMYRAKAAGKHTYAFFDPGMYTGVLYRLQIEAELRRAVEQQEFELHYQPILELASGRIVQVEALIRWQHPQRGRLAPAAFLSIAEETGLIVPISQWTFNEACRQMRVWQDTIPLVPPVCVSVNVSHKQFWHPGLIDAITNALHTYALDPGVFHVEITEGVIMRNPEAANTRLQQLHDLGIHLSIDDFGTGYSSLEALHRFPIDALKIDQSFMVRLGIDSRSTELVRTMLMMGQNLGLEVIAEGIETQDQHRLLRTLYCCYGQGYLFAKPVPGDAMGRLLVQHNGTILVDQ
jgi:diguanylate cyclase (GGDEF)-like protein/PAS domain S-box-containing protein